MKRSLLLRSKRTRAAFHKALDAKRASAAIAARKQMINPERKSGWGKGPWQRERDRYEFRAHGFDCLVTRNHHLGNLCGYVALPKGHPWHDIPSYSDVPCDAHGGLTYKDACREDICHKGNGDEVQWIGFDCAHAGDLVPGVSAAYGFLPPGFMGDWMRDDTYRTASWVRDECARIAKQARDAAQA